MKPLRTIFITLNKSVFWNKTVKIILAWLISIIQKSSFLKCKVMSPWLMKFLKWIIQIPRWELSKWNLRAGLKILKLSSRWTSNYPLSYLITVLWFCFKIFRCTLKSGLLGRFPGQSQWFQKYPRWDQMNPRDAEIHLLHMRCWILSIKFSGRGCLLFSQRFSLPSHYHCHPSYP